MHCIALTWGHSYGSHMGAGAEADANGADRAGAAAALASAALEVGTIIAQPAAGVTYPPARAAQADVLADAELFTATLREVLQALGGSLDKVSERQPRTCGRRCADAASAGVAPAAVQRQATGAGCCGTFRM